jgi:hypothetical protein
MEETKWYKSKTLNFNALYMAIVAAITQGFGIEIPAEAIAAVQTLLNIGLRFVTKGPIA